MSCSHQRTRKWLYGLTCFRTYLVCLERRRPNLRCEGVDFDAKSKNYLRGQVLFPVVNVTHTADPSVQCYRNMLSRQHLLSLKPRNFCTGVRVPKVQSVPSATNTRRYRSVLVMQRALCAQVSLLFRASTSYSLAVPQSRFATSADYLPGVPFACRAIAAVVARATREVQGVGHATLGFSAFYFCCLVFKISLTRGHHFLYAFLLVDVVYEKAVLTRPDRKIYNLLRARPRYEFDGTNPGIARNSTHDVDESGTPDGKAGQRWAHNQFSDNALEVVCLKSHQLYVNILDLSRDSFAVSLRSKSISQEKFHRFNAVDERWDIIVDASFPS